VLPGTHETVQELRAALEQEAEVSAQAFERVQAAEAELAELRADFTALQVRLGTKTSLCSTSRRHEPFLTPCHFLCLHDKLHDSSDKLMPSCTISAL